MKPCLPAAVTLRPRASRWREGLRQLPEPRSLSPSPSNVTLGTSWKLPLLPLLSLLTAGNSLLTSAGSRVPHLLPTQRPKLRGTAAPAPAPQGTTRTRPERASRRSHSTGHEGPACPGSACSHPRLQPAEPAPPPAGLWTTHAQRTCGGTRTQPKSPRSGTQHANVGYCRLFLEPSSWVWPPRGAVCAHPCTGGTRPHSLLWLLHSASVHGPRPHPQAAVTPVALRAECAGRTDGCGPSAPGAHVQLRGCSVGVSNLCTQEPWGHCSLPSRG